ncbi:hypothetical protein CBFG_05922 [Clostridiales bacterium 1_7_47FAA]|nr:hypothetical protein CBFG_05922 [Clostridiales bacterium 1_7_47FAA]
MPTEYGSTDGIYMNDWIYEVCGNDVRKSWVAAFFIEDIKKDG